MEKEINEINFNIFKYHYMEIAYNDVYSQPASFDGHFINAYKVIRNWIPRINPESVLDVGCGQGFCQEMFEKFGVRYLGIGLGTDVSIAQNCGRNVVSMDFNFIDLQDSSYDLIFARHALEHSPFPIITLMEWHRVASKWIIVVTPRPKDGAIGFIGRNHYSVVESPTQLRWWLRRAGWKVIDKFHSDDELRYLCMKKQRISYEGWCEAPLPMEVHDDDRDDRI